MTASLFPGLMARRGGVAVGVAIINASQVPCALPAVVIDLQSDEKIVSTTVVPGTIAAAETWMGEAIIPLRLHRLVGRPAPLDLGQGFKVLKRGG